MFSPVTFSSLIGFSLLGSFSCQGKLSGITLIESSYLKVSSFQGVSLLMLVLYLYRIASYQTSTDTELSPLPTHSILPVTQASLTTSSNLKTPLSSPSNESRAARQIHPVFLYRLPSFISLYEPLTPSSTSSYHRMQPLIITETGHVTYCQWFHLHLHDTLTKSTNSCLITQIISQAACPARLTTATSDQTHKISFKPTLHSVPEISSSSPDFLGSALYNQMPQIGLLHQTPRVPFST